MQAVPAVPTLHADKAGRMVRSLSLKKTLWIGCGLILLAVTGVIIFGVVWVVSVARDYTSGCLGWGQPAQVQRLPEDLLGHLGPVWGRVEGSDVIVFGWDEDRPRFGGSLYSIRPNGTGLTLLSPSIGDGRALGCYGDPLDGEQSRDSLGDFRVAFDTSPAISPDGGTVAYATLRQAVLSRGLDIVTVGLDSGELRRVTPGREPRAVGAPAGTQYEPAWSPDGTRIAFLDDGTLHTMAVDGSDARNIAPGIRSVAEPPAWSPDGTRLAFRGQRPGDENWDLYLVRADGSDLTRPLEGVVLQSWSYPFVLRGELNPRQNLLPSGKPVWSPDGRRIAIQLYPEIGASLTRGVHVLDVEAGTLELLVDLGWTEGGPVVWTPDGTEVLFYSRLPLAGPAPVIFAVTTDGDPVVRLFADLSGFENPVLGFAWSTDGTRLAVRTRPGIHSAQPPFRFRNGDAVLWTVAADGSDLRVLVRQGPEGKLVAAGEAVR